MKHILGLLAGIAALGLMLVGQPQAAASEQQLLVDPAMAQAAAAVVDVTVQSTLNVELDGAPHTVHRVVVDASNLSWVGEEVYVAIPGGLRADGSTVLLSNAAPFLNDGAQVQLAVDVRDDELQDVISQVADDPDAAVFSIVGGENGIAQRASSRVAALAAGGGFTLTGFERDDFTPPTVFRINPQFSGLSATETIAGVRAGFDRWENDAASDIDFTYGGTTGASGLNWGNGVTDVSWQLPSSTNYLDASLAVAHMVIGANGHEFEVIMSRSYAWTNGSSWNTWDLETVMAHEVGHGIGLGHMVNDQNQLMYTHIPPATVKPLGPGDLAAAAHLYPVNIDDSSEPVPVMMGDADCSGTLSVADAVVISQFAVGNRSEAPCPRVDPATQIATGSADVNGDGFSNIGDALLVAQCSVSIPNVLCP